MKETHIACGQFVTAPANKEKNLKTMADQSAEAKGRGCELIVFPEMVLTGYIPPEDLAPLAEPIDGPSVTAIADTARRLGIAIAAGFPELNKTTGVRHNSFALLGANGDLVAVYRKIHLWDTEAIWATPGTDVIVADLDGIRLSGWICYDTRFPEAARLCFFKGAELCLVPTAWLGPSEEWVLSLRARALENAFFVAGADLINKVPGLECGGHSFIADPHGEILARATAGVEGIIDAILEPAVFEEQRRRLPLRRDRRPDLYRPITDES
jgi:predicted amidohydrolase